jgi:hemolysin activation/secretion protein
MSTSFAVCAAAVLFAVSCMRPVFAQDAQNSEYQEPTFSISSFNVNGPVLVPRDQVLSILRGFTDRPIGFDELRQATVAVERLHALAGYEVVRVLIPEQDLQPGGTLKLEIVDARLDVVTVSGNDHFTSELIQESLVVLQPGALINTVEMDKNLRLINDNPANIVRVRLEPSDKPNLVDAKVQVSDQHPVSAFLTLDNTGTNATGDNRLGLALQHNNAFDRGHMAAFQYVTSPGRISDVEVFGLSYKVPFYQQASMLELAYSDSSVNAGTLSVGSSSVSVAGAGTNYAIRWSQLLPRWSTFDQRLTASYELKQFVSQVQLNGTGASLVPELESRPMGLTYSLSDTQDSSQRSFQLGYFVNHATGATNSTAQYSLSNPAARADFDLFRINVAWSDQIAPSWRLTAQMDVQHTRFSLISGEQFGAGGVYSVRGFEERVISADRGMRQSLELTGPNITAYAGNLFERLQWVGFVEAAQLKFNNATGASPSEPHLMSYGMGLRFAFNPKHQIRMDIAKVVSGVPVQPHGDVMLHVSFATSL